MSANDIGDLNLVMQNVMPAQVYTPTEPQAAEIPEEIVTQLRAEIETKIPDDIPDSESRSSCSCVDTYA